MRGICNFRHWWATRTNSICNSESTQRREGGQTARSALKPPQSKELRPRSRVPTLKSRWPGPTTPYPPLFHKQSHKRESQKGQHFLRKNKVRATLRRLASKTTRRQNIMSVLCIFIRIPFRTHSCTHSNGRLHEPCAH